jgi:8-hydroxy-5-deazaflavin:NADPH oxidoreductase
MKVAILGGTGKLGLACAVRLRRHGHEVMIGSRDAAKALEAAKSVGEGIIGSTNAEAAAWCDTAFVSVPYAGHRALLERVKERLQYKLIIDATVPIDPANILQIKTESGKSAAEEAGAIVTGASVFAAFQTISHRILRQPYLELDVLVAGGIQRKSEVMDWIRSIQLHPIDAGPIEVAGHLERITVLLLSINKANKVKESGIKITGI